MPIRDNSHLIIFELGYAAMPVDGKREEMMWN